MLDVPDVTDAELAFGTTRDLPAWTAPRWEATCNQKWSDGSICMHTFPTNPPLPEDVAVHYLEVHPHGLNRLTNRTLG